MTDYADFGATVDNRVVAGHEFSDNATLTARYEHASKLASERWQQIEDLTARVAALEKDKARLDFIESRRAGLLSNGYWFDSWQYATDKPIRDQLDTARLQFADGAVKS